MFAYLSYFIIEKSSLEAILRIFWCTSLGSTSKISDAAKKISGAGFRFSKASADTIASNLIKEDKTMTVVENNDPTNMYIINLLHKLDGLTMTMVNWQQLDLP